MYNLVKFLLKAVIWIAVLALIVGGVLRFFFVDVAVVGHDGMAPTLVAGDYVAIWRKAAANIGDVMICQHPGDLEKHVMGRVASLAGYTVKTDIHGQLMIGDDTIMRDYRGTRRFFDIARNEFVTMKYGVARFGYHEHEFFLEEGEDIRVNPISIRTGIFLLGDNLSSRGNDSRSFGEVDTQTCVGQVFMRLWPAPKRGDDIRHLPFDLI